jgi:hypothetical protein
MNVNLRAAACRPLNRSPVERWTSIGLRKTDGNRQLGQVHQHRCDPQSCLGF